MRGVKGGGWVVPGAYHGGAGVDGERRVGGDVRDEVRADVLRGGGAAVPVEDAEERERIVNAPGHVEAVEAHGRVLHRPPAPDLAVLPAADRRRQEAPVPPRHLHVPYIEGTSQTMPKRGSREQRRFGGCSHND